MQPPPAVRPIVPPSARCDPDRPVLLGLAGDSASGKSTLSRGIEYVLGVERVGRVCTDDYHRFDRAERARRGITPLSPDANHVDLMVDQLNALSMGRSVTKPTYSHATGTFGPPESVTPSEIVIVEGLLPWADRGARDAIDLAVFCEPDEMLRRRWKLERDVFERGYSAQHVVDEIRRRHGDAVAHVRPQRRSADIVVSFRRGAGTSDDQDLSCRLIVRPTLPYQGLRDMVGSLRGGGRPIRWSTRTGPHGPESVLDVDGDCPPSFGADVENVLWSALRPDERIQRERIGLVHTPGKGNRRSEALALTQLVIVTHLIGALDGAIDL